MCPGLFLTHTKQSYHITMSRCCYSISPLCWLIQPHKRTKQGRGNGKENNQMGKHTCDRKGTDVRKTGTQRKDYSWANWQLNLLTSAKIRNNKPGVSIVFTDVFTASSVMWFISKTTSKITFCLDNLSRLHFLLQLGNKGVIGVITMQWPE